MTTEHMRSAALRVVGHDDADGGVENPFDLDRREPLGEPWWQRIRENRAFCVDVIEEGPADPDVVDDYEIPRLGKTHARSGMRGEQDPLEDLRGDRLASELPPDAARSEVVPVTQGTVATSSLELRIAPPGPEGHFHWRERSVHQDAGARGELAQRLGREQSPPVRRDRHRTTTSCITGDAGHLVFFVPEEAARLLERSAVCDSRKKDPCSMVVDHCGCTVTVAG